MITTKSYTIRINNREQSAISDISIQVDKDSDFTLKEAYILNNFGGKVRELKKKEIKSRSAFSYGTFHSDDLVKEFSLHHSEYPYQIHYTYEIKDKNYLMIQRWHPLGHVPYNVPILNASLQIEYPQDFHLLTSYDHSLKFDSTFSDGSHKLIWSVRNYNASDSESFSPPFYETLPRVSIMPSSFNYGVPGNSHIMVFLRSMAAYA